MRGQKRIVKGVHARLRRAMDARERAYDPRIHLLTKTMDCRIKPGNDDFVQSRRIIPWP